jgi:hypothetical protein
VSSVVLAVACDLRYGSCDPRTEATAVLIVLAALLLGGWWLWRQR